MNNDSNLERIIERIIEADAFLRGYPIDNGRVTFTKRKTAHSLHKGDIWGWEVSCSYGGACVFEPTREAAAIRLLRSLENSLIENISAHKAKVTKAETILRRLRGVED